MAADQSLDREVVLLCFDADGPVASPALDAARRAAGVEEPRLVRVLDVGRDDATAFVVEESLNGARSVTSVLTSGGVPAEEARRIVGEAASALERARARGLHHGMLTPRSVFRMSDGSVKVRGLATEAALLEADDIPPDQATRGDTVALVALTYALLTSRWPLPGPDSGLEAAPRVVRGVAAPSEIAAGVPPDLDFVARHTLSEDGGPQTPGELVEQIEPWSPTPVGAGLEVREVRRPPGRRTEPLERDRTTGAVARPVSARSGRGAAANGRASTTRGAAAGEARAAELGALAGGAAAGAGASAAAAAGGVPRSVLGMNVDTRRADTPPALGEDSDWVPDEDAPEGGASSEASETLDPYPDVSEDPAAYEPYEEGDRGYDDGTGRPAPGGAAAVGGAVAAGAAAGTAVVAKGLGTALGAAGSLASKATGRMGGLARGAADRAAERSASRAERRQTEQWEDPLEQVRLSDTLEPTDEQLEPALPLLPGTAQEPLDKDQSRLALVVIAVFVLLAAVVGVWGLPKLWLGGTTAATPPVVTATVTASPSPGAGAPPAGASQPPTSVPTSAPPAAPIAITAASQISEDAGVQAVRTGAAAFDGNGDTLWQSTKWYGTAQYNGLKGRTTGLLLDLGQSADVHQVTFTTRGAADVTVYVGDQTKVAGTTPLGSVSQKDGESTVAAPDGGSVKGRYVILWFTALGPDGEGHFRAQVAEASV
ncbi:MAG: protein kinase family protein, partial [Lapillicoccus sp.]